MAGQGNPNDAAQMRLAGAVIAVAVIGWIVLQMVAKTYGWQSRWVLLIDLMAIGAFVWSLLVTWRIWRRRNG